MSATNGPAAAPAAAAIFRPHLYFALAGVFIIFALPLLPVPFTRDQGIYGYFGWRWLEGDVPYRDMFEGKGPVLYALYALGLWLAGGEQWGVNLLDILARAAAVMLTGRATARAAGERAGLFAAVLTALPLLGIFNFMWWNNQAETFMLPMLAGSSLLVLRGGRRDLVAAGLLSGLAVLTKFTSVLHLWPAIWLFARPGEGGRRWAGPGWYVLGLLLGAFPFLTYFTATGALYDFWEIHFRYNILYSGGFYGGGDPALPGLWFIFFLLPVLAPFAAAKIPAGQGRGGICFLGFWLADGLLQVVGQGKFFLYHWLPLVPAMGAAAGAGLAGVERLFSRPAGVARSRRIAYALLIFFAVGYGRNYWQLQEAMGVRGYLAGNLTAAEYYVNFSTEDFRLVYNQAAADFARAASGPEDTLLVFGYEPLVNLLAQRACPTRFVTRLAVSFKPRSAEADQMREKWRRQFMDELRARPPALIAIPDQDRNPVAPETSYEAAKNFPAFWAFIQSDYQPAGDIGNFHFFARK